MEKVVVEEMGKDSTFRFHIISSISTASLHPSPSSFLPYTFLVSLPPKVKTKKMASKKQHGYGTSP